MRTSGAREAQGAAHSDRVVDVDEAHPAPREVAVGERTRGEVRRVLELAALAEPGDEAAAVEAHAPERLQRHVAADRVEGHVHPVSVGDLVDRLHEVGGAVVEGEVGSELAAVGEPAEVERVVEGGAVRVVHPAR
jgi:hypothetical protein